MKRRVPAATFLATLLLLSGCGWLIRTATPIFTENLEDPEIGVRYDYNAGTHCGLQSLSIDGETWVPAGGLVAREDNNFAFNIDQGSVVLTDADHGIYTAEAGFDVLIERVIGPEPSFFPCM